MPPDGWLESLPRVLEKAYGPAPVELKSNTDLAAAFLQKMTGVIDRASEILETPGVSDALKGSALASIFRAKDSIDGTYTEYTRRCLVALGKQYPYELDSSNFWEEKVVSLRVQLRSQADRAEKVLQTHGWYTRGDRNILLSKYAQWLTPWGQVEIITELAVDAGQVAERYVEQKIRDVKEGLKDAAGPIGNLTTIVVILAVVAAVVYFELK